MPEPPDAPTRFVILAAPRTGSNLLCTLLDSHADILCHHEIFNPAGIFYALDYRDGSLDLGTIEERDQSPDEFLERVWNAPLGHRCVGFKFTRGQDESVLGTVLRDSAVRKIVLRRMNRIKTYVSTLVAEASGQWEAYDSHDVSANQRKVEVDVTQLRRHIAENEQYYARIDEALRWSGQRGLAVTYETLFDREEHARILAFLGVPAGFGRLTARSVKVNPTDLRRLVSNFADLQDALRDTDLTGELLSLSP